MFQDLGSDLGYVKCLSLVLRIVKHGLLYGGVPCASFIFMSLATHQRSATNPLGRQDLPFVAEGNTLLARYCLMAIVAIARGVAWLIENPGRTLVHLHPCVAHLLHPDLKPQLVKWWCLQTLCKFVGSAYVHHPFQQQLNMNLCELRWMGLYGAFSAKPQMGLGNAPAASDMKPCACPYVRVR